MVVGTGIGGALAVGGRVLHNRRDNFGAIGHMTVRPNGDRCTCGNRGCLETVASARALATKTATAEQVAAAAAQGDPTSARRILRAGRELGLAISSTLAFLGFSTAVVGGGVAGALPQMLPAIVAELDDRTAMLGTCHVHPGALGPHAGAGAIGAALWTLEGP